MTKKNYLLVLCLGVLLAACGPTEEELGATATGAAASTAAALTAAAPTLTPIPTATATPLPTSTATPTPSFTLTPSQTPTFTPDPVVIQAHAFADPILAIIAERPPDYADDFSNPGSGWDVGVKPNSGTGHEEGEVGYADGEYFVIAAPRRFPHPTEGLITCQSGFSFLLPELSDFVLEIDGRFVAVENGEWQIKLRDREGSGYAVSVGDDGQVNILRNGYQGTNSLCSRRVPSLRHSHESHHVRIVARGPYIAVFVNDEVGAFAVDVEPFEVGLFGLVVCNSGDMQLHARWDNLRIWDVSDS